MIFLSNLYLELDKRPLRSKRIHDLTWPILLALFWHWCHHMHCFYHPILIYFIKLLSRWQDPKIINAAHTESSFYHWPNRKFLFQSISNCPKNGNHGFVASFHMSVTKPFSVFFAHSLEIWKCRGDCRLFHKHRVRFLLKAAQLSKLTDCSHKSQQRLAWKSLQESDSLEKRAFGKPGIIFDACSTTYHPYFSNRKHIIHIVNKPVWLV